mmetsp:Transcript_16114/g.40398  ORF Transcript_16114/g.40398 Transcript_16114/m.40398 type:complete len:207 (-) Transcript_16114:247-867(-)
MVTLVVVIFAKELVSMRVIKQWRKSKDGPKISLLLCIAGIVQHPFRRLTDGRDKDLLHQCRRVVVVLLLELRIRQDHRTAFITIGIIKLFQGRASHDHLAVFLWQNPVESIAIALWGFNQFGFGLVHSAQFQIKGSEVDAHGDGRIGSLLETGTFVLLELPQIILPVAVHAIQGLPGVASNEKHGSRYHQRHNFSLWRRVIETSGR